MQSQYGHAPPLAPDFGFLPPACESDHALLRCLLEARASKGGAILVNNDVDPVGLLAGLTEQEAQQGGRSALEVVRLTKGGLHGPCLVTRVDSATKPAAKRFDDHRKAAATRMETRAPLLEIAKNKAKQQAAVRRAGPCWLTVEGRPACLINVC